MFRVPFLSATALVALSFAASAADLPSMKGAPPAPDLSTIPSFSWTGCYVGGQIGAAWLNNPNRVTNATTGAFVQDVPATGSGVKGGAFAGCNHQTTWGLVVGAEANIDAADLAARSSTINIAAVPGIIPIPGGVAYTNERINWQGSLRLRAGYAIGPALIYATGGWAFANTGIAYYGAATGGALSSATFSSSRSGWTLGGGLEYAVTDNWTVRAEYRYADLGSVRNSISAQGPFFWAGNSVSRGLTEQVVRVGVAYKFGDTGAAPEPIVAKY